MKYSIIGDEDTVLGFGMVGVSGKVADNPDDAQRAFKAVIEDSETAIIIITESSFAARYFVQGAERVFLQLFPDRFGRRLNKVFLKLRLSFFLSWRNYVTQHALT